MQENRRTPVALIAFGMLILLGILILMGLGEYKLLVIPLLSVLGVVTLIEPAVGLVVLLFSVPLEIVTSPIEKFTLAQVVGPVTALGWVGYLLRTRRLPKFPPGILPVVLFMLWAATSVFWAKNTQDTLMRVRILAQLLVLLVMMWDLLDRERWLKSAATAIVLATLVSGLMALAQRASLRAHSTMEEDHNVFAMLQTLGLVCLPLAFSALGSLRRWAQGAALLILMHGVVFAQSRGVWAAVLLSGALLLAIRTSRRAVVGTILVVATVTTFVIWVPRGTSEARIDLLERRATDLVTFESRGTHRLDIWATGFQMYTENPWLGVGLGNFPEEYGQYALRHGAFAKGGRDAHSNYLAILAELGPVGLALYLWWMFGVGRVAWMSGDIYRRTMAMAFFFCGLGVSASLTLLYFKAFWIFFAFPLCLARLRHEARAPAPQSRGSALLPRGRLPAEGMG